MQCSFIVHARRAYFYVSHIGLLHFEQDCTSSYMVASDRNNLEILILTVHISSHVTGQRHLVILVQRHPHGGPVPQRELYVITCDFCYKLPECS